MFSSSKMQLTSCQQNALEILNHSDENIFLTGSAGSGKSFLTQQFLKGKDRKLFPVLASTGSAAVLINGRTFHSFFSLGIMQGSLEQVVEKALNSKQTVNRLRKIQGFVLDEVSMISSDALLAAEKICALARKKPNLPWGGVRVIAVGDFSQLPPVSKNSSQKPWAFLSEAWRRSQFRPLILKTLVRSQDEEFLNILNLIRHGEVTSEVLDYLNSRTFEDRQDTIEAPYFFPFRRQAESVNQKRLQEIDSELFEFPTLYQGNPQAVATLKKNLFLPETLQLKKSAFVMLRINDPAYKYVNGSLGHILEILEDDDKNEIKLQIQLENSRVVAIEKTKFSIQDADGNDLATAENFPVTLAYATTIHKSQGITVEKMVADLRNLWEPGHAYVALSRLRSGDGLNLLGWDKNSIRVSSEVLEFYKSLS